MGKKHKHPEHENLERWLVSYADFITLLFATFTALYAIATADLAKLKDVSQAISEGFKQQSLLTGFKEIFDNQHGAKNESNPTASERGEGDGVLGQFQSLTYTEGEIEALKQQMVKIKETLQDVNKTIEEEMQDLLQPPTKAPTGAPPTGEDSDSSPIRDVQLTIQERGVRVSFDSRLLFQPASANLRPESLKVLDKIALRLKDIAAANLIHIEGHTDDQPIFTALYPSNWELSTARASAVVRLLIRRHGYNPAHLAAVGYADTRPVASNSTPVGRSQNRRIDIIIQSPAMSAKEDPAAQLRSQVNLIAPKKPAETHLPTHDSQLIQADDSDH